jgi:hypothetical protein
MTGALLEYELDESDRAAFRRHLEARQAPAASYQTHGIWLGIALGLLVAIPASILGLLFMRIACCGVPLMFATVWWWGLPRLAETYVKRKLASPGAQAGKHSIHLSLGGMHWVGPAGEVHVSVLDSAVVDSLRDLIVLWLPRGRPVIVPMRALVAMGGETAFITELDRTFRQKAAAE